MNILVTGGTGFVGRHLVQALQAEGHRVLLLVRDDQRLAACRFDPPPAVVRGDLFASAPFPPGIETVFHLAAVTKELGAGEFERINVAGTRALLERLRPLPGLHRVLLLSSLAAAGPSRAGVPLQESDPAAPVSRYGRSKLAQERELAERSPAPWTIVRAPIVFGPGDMDMLDMFRIVGRGITPRLGRMERWYSLIYVKDLVRGMIAAACHPSGNETFYVANPQPVEWQELMAQAARLLGKRALKITVPAVAGWLMAELAELRIRAFGRRAIFNRDKFAEMRHPFWVCSAAKIGSQLHFQPRVPLITALEETLTWYRASGLL
ncbi:MAG TPA: NAD-dependent epimerase/dehydratase family protein [Candidatus Aminicenantes bacterium]|nr:NAD-dependent epimerase/dehydratase family protein [Candidatus Aminicenantes bacterium]